MDAFQERLNRRIEKAGRNMHKPAAGGGTIAEGTAFGRLIGVVEVGMQADQYQGRPKNTNQVKLTFEFSGSKWPEINGSLVSRTQVYTNSDSSKAQLHKLMNKLDPDERYNHIAQMIGQVFLVEISHRIKGDKTYVDLTDISLPIQNDPSTGEKVDLSHKAAALSGKRMVFLWNDPLMDDWDSLYIPGTYDDGGSRNVFQQSIRAAVDFEESPIYNLLKGEGADPYEDFDPEKDQAVEGSSRKNREAAKRHQTRYTNPQRDEGRSSGEGQGGRGESRGGGRGAGRGEGRRGRSDD